MKELDLRGKGIVSELRIPFLCLLFTYVIDTYTLFVSLDEKSFFIPPHAFSCQLN